MKQVILDGKFFTDKKTTHAILKEQLELPEYYGNNLDALWDCLTTDFTDRIIIIQHSLLIHQQLDRYGRNLINLFRRVHKANPHQKIVFHYTFK